MIKAAELLIVSIFLLLSFFIGVSYSDSVKTKAEWLFDIKDEQEIDFSNSSVEIKKKPYFVEESFSKD
jgi:hypothetical protein